MDLSYDRYKLSYIIITVLKIYYINCSLVTVRAPQLISLQPPDKLYQRIGSEHPNHHVVFHQAQSIACYIQHEFCWDFL